MKYPRRWKTGHQARCSLINFIYFIISISYRIARNVFGPIFLRITIKMAFANFIFFAN